MIIRITKYQIMHPDYHSNQQKTAWKMNINARNQLVKCKNYQQMMQLVQKSDTWKRQMMI